MVEEGGGLWSCQKKRRERERQWREKETGWNVVREGGATGWHHSWVNLDMQSSVIVGPTLPMLS
ncbi:hypothetical protein TIFTF001_021583 [Ficus carica]|uniref:Uncharacterized protein n=1 Tax=Ficus carica TaxID=3494 RepID=A0AA88ASR3_FICCA|nr:hypothetical protein TIFTF001_021583 [Ficus carica]